MPDYEGSKIVDKKEFFASRRHENSKNDIEGKKEKKSICY